VIQTTQPNASGSAVVLHPALRAPHPFESEVEQRS